MTFDERLSFVLDALDDLYHKDDIPDDCYATGEPLDGLILTVLSQNTNDRNRDTAYDRLRAELPTWADVAGSDTDEIASLIKPAGLSDTKSKRIKIILEKIREDFGDYSLAQMKSWDVERARDYLIAFDGVGPKTVGCVLLFDLMMPAFPVDTHVARVSRRVGLCDPKDTPEKIQLSLERSVPRDRCKGGHLNIIEHGRQICRARDPRCGACPLVEICENK